MRGQYSLFVLLSIVAGVLCATAKIGNEKVPRVKFNALDHLLNVVMPSTENNVPNDHTIRSTLPMTSTSSLRVESTTSTSFTQTFNTVIYGPDNSTISEASGFGLDYCTPRPQSGSATNSMYTTVVTSDSTSITLTVTYYTGVSDCSGTPSSTVTHSVPVWTGHTTKYDSCSALSTTDDDYNAPTVTFPVKMHNYISNAAPYNSFPSGQVYKQYYNNPNCKDSTSPYTVYTWNALARCGDPLTFDGYCNLETFYAEDEFKTKIQVYKGDCNTLAFTSVVSTDIHCITYSDSLESYIDYYTKTSNDDDTVTLSEAEYGGLIAAVFCALIVGIAATSLIFIYWFGAKFTSGPLAEKFV